jgi:hypothetical protein
MEVENQVEFTYISEVFVEDLHEHLHQLEDNQLVMVFVNNCDKIQTRVAFVNYLILFIV